MMQETFCKFMESSAAADTTWSADTDREEVVGSCPSCGAELRISIEECGEWRFPHHDGCPHSDEKRAQRLAEQMLTIVAEETDDVVMFSAVALFSAMLCAGAAGASGASPDVVTKRFVRDVEQRVGGVSQMLAARENVA